MSQEIERKFLVKGDLPEGKTTRIVQGYLSSVPERTVRVRVKGERAFLTIKGIGNETGISRYEWEKEIPVQEAEQLLKICEPGVIEKTRTEVEVGKHTFEIDHFFGDNEGLVMAEVELSDEAEQFDKPDWLGEEVSGDKRYYNSYLSQHPFKTWK
ncbi:CYTH domain-containing protein [Limibacter armeniacum]|uniref:CYTH domain-containing protein n=1 Tax=Limibacter armeniacum TaxID=466084 RepID=UPI002FE55596